MARSIRFWAILEIACLISFVIGFFARLDIFIIAGGSVLVLIDLVGMLAGRLSPFVPIAGAILLAVLISPWYYGIFLAFAIIEALNIPMNIGRIISPNTLLKEIEKQRDLQQEARLYNIVDP